MYLFTYSDYTENLLNSKQFIGCYEYVSVNIYIYIYENIVY